MPALFSRRIAAVAAVLLIVCFILVTSSSAATTSSVTATVTAQNISVSVTDGTVTYGSMSVSTTKDTTTSGLNDSQIATNDGNTDATFNIRGQNSANWTLAATAGADQYTHKFCTATCDTTPTWTALSTSYATLGTSIAVSGTVTFDVQLGTPTSSTNFTQQSVDITVQAVAP